MVFAGAIIVGMRNFPRAPGHPFALPALGLLFLPQALAAEELVLEIEPAALVVSGLEPAAEVVVYGISRRAGEGGIRQRVEHEALLVDDDDDGQVTFEMDAPVDYHSIWVVVDRFSGEYVVDVPPGSPRREVEFPGRGPEEGSRGQLNRLRHEGFGFVHLLLVRPGEGAWTVTAADGGPYDSDGSFADGVLLEIDQARAVAGEDGVEEGTAAPPERFAPGDVVVVIDSDRMSFYAARLPGGGAGG